MDLRREWKALAAIVAAFVLSYHLPVDALRDSARFTGAVWESLYLVRWYAREHVLLCLVPAFFIAGAISVFVSQASVMRYLGAGAPKAIAYGVASVSGTVLAVCSCTVLPLFAGIYRMGAGLGPATAFLYAGPAINVLAVVLTARVLGLELGIARAVGAILFSVVVGLGMHLLFRREEREKAAAQAAMPVPDAPRPLRQTALFIAAMVAVLVFANWGRPGPDAGGLWLAVYAAKWWIAGLAAAGLAAILVAWFGVRPLGMAFAAAPAAILAVVLPNDPAFAFSAGALGLAVVAVRSGGETAGWFDASWGFARQILPLLLGGVLVAGLLLGRPGHEGLVPAGWIERAVGGNSLRANLFASVAGALMYFATLTEVPILQGLIGAGMGKGPALALLLAGPALSLPNMLVIRSVIGTRKTLAFVALVVVMATVAGIVYGAIF
ncbi:MAG: permease [Candidatus Krumholzibacteriota bacterium]|nr:permease [Candidatus Krumholzibacteriota bacterium]